MNAVSEENAVTFHEAVVINPNGFHRFTLRLAEQGVLRQRGEKYYLDKLQTKFLAMQDGKEILCNLFERYGQYKILC